MKKVLLICSAIFILGLPLFGGKPVSMLFYGEASWYGQKFQGKTTANGEVFDINKLTASHKSLPYGSLVKVTNLENEKNVIVRINHHGSLEKGRVIDLSFAAAAILGFTKKQSTKVEVRVLTVGSGKAVKKPVVQKKKQHLHENKQKFQINRNQFHQKKAKVKVVSPSFGGRSGEYVIQAGAYGNRENASLLVGKMRQVSLRAFVYSKGSRFYRVWIGYFTSRSEADKRLSLVRSVFSNAFIKKVR